MKLAEGLRVKPAEDTFVAIGGQGVLGMVIKTTDVFTLRWRQRVPDRLQIHDSRLRSSRPQGEEFEWVLEREDGLALKISEALVQHSMVPA